jgi:hypothetical protein
MELELVDTILEFVVDGEKYGIYNVKIDDKQRVLTLHEEKAEVIMFYEDGTELVKVTDYVANWLLDILNKGENNDKRDSEN